MRTEWSKAFVSDVLSRIDRGTTIPVLAASLGMSADNLRKGLVRVKRGVTPRRLHGRTAEKTYDVWVSMKQRCSNPNDPAYKDYGARGITVCSRWVESYEAFMVDMGTRPAGWSIERIENNGNYEPTNCKWAPMSVQQRNRRGNVLVALYGVEMILSDACRKLGAAPTHAYWYINKGCTAQEAVHELIKRKERRDAKNLSKKSCH